MEISGACCVYRDRNCLFPETSSSCGFASRGIVLAVLLIGVKVIGLIRVNCGG